MGDIYVGVKTSFKSLYDCMFLKNPRQLYFIVSKDCDTSLHGGILPCLFYDFEQFVMRRYHTLHEKEFDELHNGIEEYMNEKDISKYDLNLITKILMKFEELYKYNSLWSENYTFLFSELAHKHKHGGYSCEEIDLNKINDQLEKLRKYIVEINLKDSTAVMYIKM